MRTRTIDWFILGFILSIRFNLAWIHDEVFGMLTSTLGMIVCFGLALYKLSKGHD